MEHCLYSRDEAVINEGEISLYRLHQCAYIRIKLENVGELCFPISKHNVCPAEVLLCSAKDLAHSAKLRADSAKDRRLRAEAASKSDVPLKFCILDRKSTRL